ncbi:MAG: ATP-binding protein [Cyanobacteria bacterium P01_A01_bin.84]
MSDANYINSGASIGRLTMLNKITRRIRQSLDLPTVLNTTVVEIRNFLKTDRVKIYKFDSQGNGQVIAESIRHQRLPSLKGLHFPAGDIPPQARELFCKSRVRSIVDLQEQQIRLSEPNRLPSTAIEELTVEEVKQQSLKNLLQRPVDPCHVEYLTLMGIKSSLVIPILDGKKLWGLLISHNATPKKFSEDNLQVVQMIAEQVELAISQANLVSNMQAKMRREKAINQISSRVYSSIKTEKILQAVLQDIVKESNGDGGILLLTENMEGEKFFTTGSQPQLLPWEWLELFQAAKIKKHTKVIKNIYSEGWLQKFISAFNNTNYRSLLLTNLQYNQEILGYLAIFRDEIDTDKLWAGYPDSDERQLRPRQSFEEWKEIIKGEALEWSQGDKELLESLSNHLGIAILQHNLYRREKEHRRLVEIRNQELDTARTSAEEANRLKSDFLSSTSHELRTPLASTLNYLKLLKERFYDSEEELHDYIQAAHLSTENLLKIINDVLDIAKIEAGRMQVDLKPIELQPFLEKKRKFFKPETLHRDINFVIECEVETISADVDKLEQVLINLLSNAFKFTSKGEIKLKVISQEHFTIPVIEFSVSDTGIGIDTSQQSTIFEAFVQADGSVRRRYGGTGLGLTICRHLVELMGGEIGLESKGKDMGTTVTFTLPALKNQDISKNLTN